MMLFAVAAMTLSMMAMASSHPHVLPTVRADLIFSPAGRVTAIQYAWLYDSAYSTFAGRDIDADKDGTISAASSPRLPRARSMRSPSTATLPL